MPDLASLPPTTTNTASDPLPTTINNTTSAFTNNDQPPHLSPSPRPPPSSSTLLNTSTPGPRATALQSIFTTALTHVLHTISYPNFSSCFPTPASSTSGSLILESVWRQVMQGLEEKCKREFEEILVERDVVSSLGELERVVADARGRMEDSQSKMKKGESGKGEMMGMGMGTRALHTLPPEDLLLAHLHPFLTDASRDLNLEMATLAKENEVLVRGIEAQREEVEGLVRGLEAVVGDLEAANAVLMTAQQGGGGGGGSGEGEGEGKGKGNLKSEAVDMEFEMEGGMDGIEMARSRL